MKLPRGTKFYRGYDDDVKRLPILWFAVDKNIAEGYASRRVNGKVRNFMLNREFNIVDIGRSEEHTTPLFLLSEIIKQSNVKLNSVKEEAFDIKKVFDKHKERESKHLCVLKHMDTFVKALLLFKVDGFLMTEGGATTYGLLGVDW